MSEPLVSVVVPCYNHEKYVQECIKSIIDQDYQNIELIIIDDGSKDGSVEKIQELVHACKQRFSRFEFISRPNRGLCATLNEAVAWCQGKYFSPIASDDVLECNKLSVLMPHIQSGDNIAVVFGAMQLISHKGEKVGVKSQNREHFFKDLILHDYLPFTPASLMRTDSIKRVGCFSEELGIEDWFMWLKLAELKYRLISIETVVVNYRCHDDNLSQKLKVMHEERLRVLNHFKDSVFYKDAMCRIKFMGLRSIAIREIIYPVRNIYIDKDMSLIQKSTLFVISILPRVILEKFLYLYKSINIGRKVRS